MAFDTQDALLELRKLRASEPERIHATRVGFDVLLKLIDDDRVSAEVAELFKLWGRPSPAENAIHEFLNGVVEAGIIVEGMVQIDAHLETYDALRAAVGR